MTEARGRKARAKGPARTQTNIRLTEGERRAWEIAAKASGRRNVSDYVRLVVGTHITLRGPAEAARALLGE